jgi:cell division protein FtsL
MQQSSMGDGRRWSNREVRREVDRHRALWLWGLLLGLVIAAAPTAVHLHHQNLCLELRYEINALRQERSELQERQRRLLAQRAALESPASIERWGRERRGLVHPSPQQVVVIRRAVPQRTDLVVQEMRSGRER